MEIVTGYRAEPHITSQQDRWGNMGIIGEGSYVLTVGSGFAAEIVTNNEISISGGVLCHQGCVAVINSGTHDTVEIDNGDQGMKRIDLIVARYTIDANTGVEDVSLHVIKGTPAASNPSTPAHAEGLIENGDSPVDMPLYRVWIDGLSITDVTPVFNMIRTQQIADTAIDSMDEDIIRINMELGSDGTYTPTFTASAGTNPTILNPEFRYMRIGALLVITGRFNLSALGGVGTNAHLKISVPSGFSYMNFGPGAAGLVVGQSSETAHMMIRSETAPNGYMYICTSGGGYPSLATGNHSILAFCFLGRG